jgi:glyoxylase-like metal-dependent hydrolase (beta-lactamase superfamily II)
VAIAAGGHTPGSTVFAARVGEVTWILAGDMTNSRAALLANEPKPALYSLFIVPEAPARLERMRLWLSALDAESDVTVVVSHDQPALEASGMSAWPAN